MASVGEEVRCLQHVLAAHPVAAAGQTGIKVLFKPVVHHVEPGHLGRAAAAHQVRELLAGAAAGVTAEDNDLVARPAETAGKPAHGRPVQDQLVGVERVLAKEQVMLDQHKHGTVRRIELLAEQLMRQNQAQVRAGHHFPTIGGCDASAVSNEPASGSISFFGARLKDLAEPGRRCWADPSRHRRSR